jgi:hypothetical protein
MKKSPILVLPLLPVIVFLMSSGLLSAADSEASSYPAMYRVAWEEPGKLAAGAMPTGNGDISVNAWVEKDGDLIFYIGKTDSWSEIERLLKVGKVRVRISPNPFKAALPFRQELRMEEAAIVVQVGAPGSAVNIRIWVDANRPVIRLECTADQPVEVTASTEIWRTTERDLPQPERMSAWSERDNPGRLLESPDVLVAGRKSDVLWYHRNASSTWEDSLRLQGLEKLIGEQRDPLRDRTFGVLMRGDHFVPAGAGTLKAPAAGNWCPLETEIPRRRGLRLANACGNAVLIYNFQSAGGDLGGALRAGRAVRAAPAGPLAACLIALRELRDPGGSQAL